MLKSEEKKIKLNKLVGDISDEINEIIDDNPSLNTKEYQQFREEYEAWLDERAREEEERND